jgi:nitrite reductase/ring-hydroxylating ferredoxin subunit
MNRNDFLKQIGFKGAALMALYCSGACEYQHLNLQPKYEVDFTVELKDPANASLLSAGGFIVSNNVVIARPALDQFVAASLVCSHEWLPEITFDNARNIFSCNAHGAAYDLTGKGLNERGKNGLKIYQTQLTGTSLRIYG